MRTKKASKPSISKALEKKMLGDEPILSANPTTAELAVAYKWYRDFYDPDTSKKFAIDYLSEINYDRATVAKLKKVDAAFFGNLGYSFRIISTGYQLPTESMTYVWKRVKELANTVVVQEPVVRTSGTNSKADSIIADFEDVIDYFVLGEFDTFDVVDYLKANNVTAAVSSRVADYYQPLAAELAEAVSGRDNDLREAYGHWDKNRLLAYFNLVKAIVMAALGQEVAVKKERKPRAKKVKPPSVLAAKVQYLKASTEYKIKSVPPERIVGANQVWLFNVKYRTLTVLNSANSAGLTIKGTTVLNFDEETSIAKRLRKPEPVLTSVLESGKVALRKIMDAIKTTALIANGRIGKDTVILKVM